MPDDSLQGFPFAALNYKGQYLIERFAISIGLTITGRNVNRNQTVSEALVVAVPNSAESVEFGWIPPLPGTVTEINHVQRLLSSRGANVLRVCSSDSDGSIVSKSLLLRELQRVGLAHIACHGIFKTDQPDQSGLILVHDDQAEILSLRDLAELDLSHLQHITLSACWLADSFVLPGRWAISLPEVLWRAGVGSILGSLWPVSDNAAGKIMARFYQYSTEAPRDLALQRALRDCAQGALDQCAECPVTDPFYWAGYYLYGDRSYYRVSPSG